jgi:hypothetical protein
VSILFGTMGLIVAGAASTGGLGGVGRESVSHSECSSTLKSASQAQTNADSRYSLVRRVYDNRRQSSSGDRG